MNIQSYNIIKVLRGYKRPNIWQRFRLAWLAFALAFCLASPQLAKAEQTDKAAHFGVSFALTTGFYGLYKAIGTRDCRLAIPRPSFCPLKGSERLAAAAFAAASSFAVGLLKEMGDRRLDGGDILANGLGSVGAMTSIVVFEF